jgi:hypothetical protein
MATLTTKNFSTLVQEWAAVCQSSVAAVFPTQVLSFTKGAVFRALAEAQASVSLWLQALILQLLTVTRLQTSKGIDVDTFCADMMPPAPGGAVMPDGRISPRLPANAATGLVTFARATPTNPAVIPVGAIVQSIDGTQTFTVYADPTNSAYSVNAGGAGIAGYTIPAAVASLIVPVQAVNAGTFGNVQAGAITIIQTGMSGIDTVTNVAAFINGFNAESDVALMARFKLFINSLGKGTEGAIGFAVVSVQQGMQYQIITNPPPAPGAPPAVTLYVDDGSGAIPAATLLAATTAAVAMRAAGISLGVFAATKLFANVVMTITTAPGYLHTTLVAQVVAAVTSYINGLGLGATPTLGQLSYLRLSQVAFDASPGVIDVTAYTLNGVAADLVPAAGQTIKSGTIVVS